VSSVLPQLKLEFLGRAECNPRFAWPRTWRFPQRCLRSDRLSATSGSYEEVLRSELRRGVEVVESGETVDSAASFARGQGRHGPF